MKDQLYSLENHYRKADKLMLMTCGGLFLLTLVLAFLFDAWSAAFIVGLPSLGIAIFFYKTASGMAITRIVFACVFMVFCALNIHQGQGMLELHFGIFGLLAVLLYYRDWLAIVAASAVIAVHHLTFYYLQSNGSSVYLFESADRFSIVIVHAAYVVFECGVLCYMAVNLHKEAKQAQELDNINSSMNQGTIDLTGRYDSQSPMVQGFNNFMTFLDEIIGESVKIAAQLSETGQVLSEKNNIVLSRVESQQEDSKKVENAVHDITESSATIAQSSARAEEIAADADRGMKQGLSVISGTQDTINSLSSEVLGSCDIMKKLQENSQSIGGVLDVIRSIAEQTNLLALNAAIEAARAGEQGRGFAVVADEVRSLASRTQASTEEIHSMIETLRVCTVQAVESSETSQKLVEKGVEDIQTTADLLESLAQTNQEVHQMSRDIAKNTGQQSSLVETINELVSNMNEAGIQTYEDCRQSAKACQTQINAASSLNDMMKKFIVS